MTATREEERIPGFMMGIDVGSTTVKSVVVDVTSDVIVWSDYKRHDTKQPEMTLEFLRRIEAETGVTPDNTRVFITGSGGGELAPLIGAKFVQEVNAVSMAVERLYPEAGSVVELGGQDAKIIIFKEDEETGRKKKIPSMNDKCAGGTGAVIDKINAKLKIPAEKLCDMGYSGLKLHPVAGKCGVFAETDINGLQKQGVPPDELMASLFDAIIQQNLSVLTRGNTLRPHVLLLGGPNTYIRGMVEAWKEAIPQVWKDRRFPLPEDVEPAELIRVPEKAHLFAAIGAVEFGKSEDADIGRYRGWQRLDEFIRIDREKAKLAAGSGQGLAGSAEELAAFRERFRREPFVTATFGEGETVRAFVGIDGGSTSTKAVLVGTERQVLAKAYQLSKGNPIEDSVEVVDALRQQVEEQGARLEVLGVGTTGYAKDILRDVLGADAAIVETVAHTESALHFYDDVDVVCDVGGQDIKIIILKNRQVKDFKLNTQCSAGNGYFLQSTAETFGFKVEEFADAAFSARAFPEFGYGCAVFMQSDIVDFQRKGWEPQEIMAGLANVLPKNIWLYVSQIPNLAKLGRNFVLQGGTQYNLAAVKAQVDFIEKRFVDKGEAAPNIWVHRHAGESGAIGAALEAARLHAGGHRTSFIGMDAMREIAYTTTRSEATRCYFCKNKCLRTFIDVTTAGTNGGVATVVPDVTPDATVDVAPDAATVVPPADPLVPPLPATETASKSKVPLADGAKRLIIATCEKGTVEDLQSMREIKKGLDSVKKQNPDLIDEWARAAFRSWKPAAVASPAPRRAWSARGRRRAELVRARSELRIGLPRVLNLYSTAPFFTAYLEALGVSDRNIVFSDYTSEELYKAGSKRGSIDPCFPSKVANAHVHNLLSVHHAKRELDLIVFPMLDCLTSPLAGTQGSRVCPTVAATPEAVKAAYTKEGNAFAERGIRYVDTFVNLSEPALCSRQLFADFEPVLGLDQVEHERAMAEAYAALERFTNAMRQRGREVLEMLEREERVGIVVLARPYHSDPGLNHEITTEFQKLGYPVIAQDCLPVDGPIVERIFREDLERGRISDPMSISDVWKNSYSENTSRKVWAAKFTARHPNLVALELSSFKCGHDAPIYSVIEEIVESSGTPYFSFKDIDENKPSGSIKIRVETIDYFLGRYVERLRGQNRARRQIEDRLREYEHRLRTGAWQPAASVETFLDGAEEEQGVGEHALGGVAVRGHDA
ncbi:MAG: BadF/BadG/BcrA/BcrD ATPase family protein [Candidatus Eiseniibacteriota bacterium]|jgi:predicted CoA-substrate-specific enzyme activase